MPRGGNGKGRNSRPMTGVLKDWWGGAAMSAPMGGGRGGRAQQRRRRGQRGRGQGFGPRIMPGSPRDFIPGGAYSPVAPSAGHSSEVTMVPQVQAPKAQVDLDRCAACGDCVDVCPTQSIEIQDGHAVVGDGCIACGVCVTQCPNGAISLE